MTLARAVAAVVVGLVGLSWQAQLVGQQDNAVQPGSFSFREDRSRMIAASIADENGMLSISWPDTGEAAWDSALLGVQLTADPSVPLPYIEVSAGGVSDRQYFGTGDSGQRWLNLSFLRGVVTTGAKIGLRREGVTLGDSKATLRLFAGNPDLSRSILVLAPHPDDAEIAAFGIYANRRATVVTITAGNAGVPTYESVFEDMAELYLFKGRIRLIDSITVPWQGGIPPDRTFNMGYFDARLAEMHDKRDAVVPEMYRPNADINVYRKDNIGSLLPKRSRESRWDNLVEDMLTLLRRVDPAVIVAPHPQLDTHRDHQFTTVALAEAMARWRDSVTPLLYTNHADRNRYPYGPAGTMMSLPPPPPLMTVSVDRMYSHPVSPSLQRQKLFALESMHDLRFTPTRQYQLAKESGLRSGDREFEDRAAQPEKVGPPPDITYLRRGPRSNELFYLYDRQTFDEMVKAFLAGRKTS
jgi:LmbE family N-acetylglucosaminyl deacetylase